jgi:hypothetical protein
MTATKPSLLLSALGIENENDAPRLAAAYLYFAKVVREFINDGSEHPDSEKRDHRIFGLLQALRTSLQLIVIELEESDDPRLFSRL